MNGLTFINQSLYSCIPVFSEFLTWEYSKNTFCKLFQMSHVIDSHSSDDANMNIPTSGLIFI